MTREDIIKLAREAGGSAYSHTVVFSYAEIERFSELVAAAEQEAAHSELQQAVVAVGLVCPEAIDDADGYDGCVTLDRINALHTVIRARGKE